MPGSRRCVRASRGSGRSTGWRRRDAGPVGAAGRDDLVRPHRAGRGAPGRHRTRAGGRGTGSALVGGQAAVLVFAFAILAAATLRGDLHAARRRLAWHGGRSWQTALLTGVEAWALPSAGAVLGARGRCRRRRPRRTTRRGRRPARARRERVQRQDARARSRRSSSALAGVLAAAATFTSRGSGDARFSALDGAAVVALLIVAVAAYRGGDGDLTLLLPGLATFGAAVLVARLLRPALRLLERATRRSSVALRLAVLSLARNPGYAVLTTAFLVVSFGLALFAESYRATLSQGERDQAAYAVPRDFLVREDLTRLIPVLDAARSNGSGRSVGVEVDPVLRLTGGVSRLEGESGVTVLGVPPASLPRLDGWRDDFGDSPAELASRIERDDALRGTALPDGLDELVADVEGGANVAVVAQLADSARPVSPPRARAHRRHPARAGAARRPRRTPRRARARARDAGCRSEARTPGRRSRGASGSRSSRCREHSTTGPGSAVQGWTATASRTRSRTSSPPGCARGSAPTRTRCRCSRPRASPGPRARTGCCRSRSVARGSPCGSWPPSNGSRASTARASSATWTRSGRR